MSYFYPIWFNSEQWNNLEMENARILVMRRLVIGNPLIFSQFSEVNYVSLSPTTQSSSQNFLDYCQKISWELYRWRSFFSITWSCCQFLHIFFYHEILQLHNYLWLVTCELRITINKVHIQFQFPICFILFQDTEKFEYCVNWFRLFW